MAVVPSLLERNRTDEQLADHLEHQIDVALSNVGLRPDQTAVGVLVKSPMYSELHKGSVGGGPGSEFWSFGWHDKYSAKPAVIELLKHRYLAAGWTSFQIQHALDFGADCETLHIVVLTRNIDQPIP